MSYLLVKLDVMSEESLGNGLNQFHML
ncbi:hypothetical protein MXB_1916 [Myxobolus squamalis]|nr:hypothetical protein MXB_1916 [Myxobolus squamalis]